MVLLRNLLALVSKRDRLAQRIYDQCVAAARAPAHYGDGSVADSVDGRFAMLTLHLFIAAHRLRGAGPEGEALVQALVDCFIRDMDCNLREMGAGDVGVAKNVKQMALALNGQLHAYERALVEGPEGLATSLSRNVFAQADARGTDSGRTDEGLDQTAGQSAVRRLTGYTIAQIGHLSAQADADCVAGRCRMLPVPAAYGEERLQP
ncbi:MAG: ubiquinol-cytochrome C chaperone family protein [Alphaproteobacteria bacterium]